MRANVHQVHPVVCKGGFLVDNLVEGGKGIAVEPLLEEALGVCTYLSDTADPQLFLLIEVIAKEVGNF